LMLPYSYCDFRRVMAEAESEPKSTESEPKFLEYSGPVPGVKYPLSVIYCPPDSECASSFAGLLTWIDIVQFLVAFLFLLRVIIISYSCLWMLGVLFSLSSRYIISNVFLQVLMSCYGSITLVKILVKLYV